MWVFIVILGDNVYNPITGALNIGQTEEHPATETKTYVGKARGTAAETMCAVAL